MEIKKTVDEVASDVKAVRGFWAKLFGTAPTSSPKPVAKKKEAYVAVNETQVMADIVTQLSQFFKLQEQLAEHIREEEEKSAHPGTHFEFWWARRPPSLNYASRRQKVTISFCTQRSIIVTIFKWDKFKLCVRKS